MYREGSTVGYAKSRAMKRALSRKNVWESLPLRVKSGVGWMLGWLPPQWLLGRQFRESLAFVNEAQWWSADRARQYQLERVREVCSLAYQETEYYRRVFDSVGLQPSDLRSLQDLATLPMIDKETLREHLQEMCTKDSSARGVDYVSTGGSGGAPLRFYIGAGRSATEYAYLVAGWQRVGYQLVTPQAVLRGQVVRANDHRLRHEYDPILRRHYYSNFHTSDEDIRKYLDHISRIGPCFLFVYPSSVAALARFVEHTGIAGPGNIRGILAGSEIVYPEDRAVAERVFAVRYFSWYGHSEKLVMAAECEHSTDYHVWPTYGYAELLDECDQPVNKPGQRGEIVATGFINTIVPFIRYRTGDYATYVDDHCEACGRQHVVIRDIRGHRTQEMLVAEDGSLISWTALNMHDDTFERVRQFQFYQDTPGRATLRLVPLNGFGEADRRRIAENVGKKVGDRLQFQIETCDTLPIAQSGKTVYVDQRIDGLCGVLSVCPLCLPEATTGPSFDSECASRPRHADLPAPPDLPGRRIITPVSVLRVAGVRPASQIVYANPFRKAITFLLQEGIGWTLAKIRSKLFYRRIARHAAVIVVVGKVRGTEQWCVAWGQQFSPYLPSMLFREELVFPTESREGAAKVAKAVADGLSRDPQAAQRLANFSHYSAEQAPSVPGAPKQGSFGDAGAPSADVTRDTALLPPVGGPAASEHHLILVGAGDYAYTFVLPHLDRHRFDMVIDYNPVTAQAVAKHFHFNYVETDYRRVLGRASSLKELTLVVASYHSHHAGTALAFLEANPRACVMIEKPPVMDYDELAQLLPYFEDDARLVEVGFNRRYATMVRRAFDELAGRSEPINVTCIIREDNMEPSHWYFWETEGTRIYGNLCHWIDLGVHLIRMRPVEIVAIAGQDFQVACTVNIRFEDDSLLNLVSGVVGNGLRGVQEFIDIRSGDLTMQIHDFRRMVIQRGTRQQLLRSHTRDKGHRAMYRCFCDNVHGPKRSYYSARDLVHTSVLTEEIRQMMMNGERRRMVDLDVWSRRELLPRE